MTNYKRANENLARQNFGNQISQQSQQTISLETHFYDGKLQDRTKIFSQPPDSQEVNEMFSFFESQINSVYLSGIKRDFLISGGVSSNNFDHTNHVDAVSILVAIYQKHKAANTETQKDLLEILKMQLEEMSSGFCPQGRCTRLLQVFFAFD